ncbi:hypothetical protein HYH02_009360 [Chlamydomonas schloesseri]|uniref:BZIP domain-containing protein n=1 Tax=Chlamydomonas schloesseri TaxID=2026947 RepID=A0A835W899_9CHLO|nr:hypothetical protein HYH02_009360 [Chlamydomonas schloesseri]|eukprot:KAG2443290.1 hypothetical protein HYH02_009360 [Chlamydomonas schloesseri]
MELELAESLGAESLAAYLNGSFIAEGSLEQTLEAPSFLGELAAITGTLEAPFSIAAPELPAEHKSEELPTTSGAATGFLPPQSETGPMSEDCDGGLMSEEDADGGATSGKGGGKRRRRIRTERQQVLNRLAQQRYRQRKKEKVAALQHNVDALQSQLERVSFLEAQCDTLRGTVAQLGADLAAKDAGLAAAQSQLRQTAVLLKGAQDKCTAQERQLAEQAQVLEAQRAQLRTSSLAGLDPQALSDRLLALVKEAFAAAAAERSSEIDGAAVPAAPAGAAAAPSAVAAPAAQAPLAMSEEVVAALSRSLTCCCRELVFASKGLGGKQAAAEAPSVIPVQCC